METSREAARIAIESTMAQLKEIVPDVPFDAPVTLHAITPYSQTMQTTFGREVAHRNFRSFGFHASDVVPLSSCGLPVYMLFIIGPWYERLTFVVSFRPLSHLRDRQIRVLAGEQVRCTSSFRCVTHPCPSGNPT